MPITRETQAIDVCGGEQLYNKIFKQIIKKLNI